MEVVEWQGGRFLRATAMSAFEIPLPETLPERFTIEFDAYSPNGDWIALMTSTDGFEGGAMNYSQFPGSYFLVTGDEAGVEGKGPEAKTNSKVLRQGVVPVRISVDGAYAKMYLGEHRVANVPNANIVRGNKLHLIFWYARAESPSYLSHFRVFAGGEEQYDALYEALEAEGRIATQGILFDTGSDVLRPESTPTLQEIGQTLKDYPDLRLAIEGHTDNVGSEAANQALSEARAAAVKAFLVAAYGLDETRLEAHGFGPSKPMASNDTPEGRQQNRRVELVKL
ncbi:MAG TPA: OmpA family protein [Rhodothermales bacterium]|nr:OmpA family protein [Rhodothermales bacterium]